MLYHYYDENVDEGAALLALEGFIDSDEDGWLEGPGPDGPGTVELDPIVVEGHPTTQIDIFVDTVVQALLNLNISAEARQTSFNDYNPRLNYHGDYDMVFHGLNWNSLDLDYYARDMSTEYVNTPLYNTPNWSNATWDSHVDTVLHSTDYDEILDAVTEMENIWVHAQPALIMYQNTYFTAARTDNFEGITPTIFDGPAALKQICTFTEVLEMFLVEPTHGLIH
jgi:ABC-type transport system substrate-binding protein